MSTAGLTMTATGRAKPVKLYVSQRLFSVNEALGYDLFD